MFAWSHTTYAIWHGIVFNFEWKRDLDYFLAHAVGSERVFSSKVYKDYDWSKIIKVEASCSKKDSRYKEVMNWYVNQRCAV